jgi:hypothetical protein
MDEATATVLRGSVNVSTGHQPTLPPHFRMSALAPKADITKRRRHVRLVPLTDSCNAAKNQNYSDLETELVPHQRRDLRLREEIESTT